MLFAVLVHQGGIIPSSSLVKGVEFYIRHPAAVRFTETDLRRRLTPRQNRGS